MRTRNGMSDLTIILLRDHSDESRKAEQVLTSHNIEHAQLFLSNDRKHIPCLLTQDIEYKGVENIEWFALNTR